MVSPKLEGTNALIEHTSCCFIYSNKAQNADTAILDVFELEREAIQRAREFEDVIQFAMRGALRRPDYAGAYNVYLYDLRQAEVLAEYLSENGIADYVELVAVEEAGILDRERASSRGLHVVRSEEGRAQQQARRRAKAAERQRRRRAKKRTEDEAKGVIRAPGRPSQGRPKTSLVRIRTASRRAITVEELGQIDRLLGVRLPAPMR